MNQALEFFLFRYMLLLGRVRVFYLQCVSIKGLGFRRGSYKCVCQKGFYFRDAISNQSYFEGSVVEEEYEKLMMVRRRGIFLRATPTNMPLCSN